jgi:hypothetical protein
LTIKTYLEEVGEINVLTIGTVNAIAYFLNHEAEITEQL